MTSICQWNGKTDMVGTVGIKHWNYSGCFLTDTTHGCLSLSNNLCLASGKAVSKMIFVCVQAGHKNTSIFLGNIPRSGFATDLETVFRNYFENVSLRASWKELLHEINSGISATKM